MTQNSCNIDSCELNRRKRLDVEMWVQIENTIDWHEQELLRGGGDKYIRMAQQAIQLVHDAAVSTGKMCDLRTDAELRNDLLALAIERLSYILHQAGKAFSICDEREAFVCGTICFENAITVDDHLVRWAENAKKMCALCIEALQPVRRDLGAFAEPIARSTDPAQTAGQLAAALYLEAARRVGGLEAAYVRTRRVGVLADIADTLCQASWAAGREMREGEKARAFEVARRLEKVMSEHEGSMQ